MAHRSPVDLLADAEGAHPFRFMETSSLEPELDCETYISDLRTFVPFETLRSELVSHLSSLHGDLLDIINRDYNDLVNLSTNNLVDVEGSIVRMRAPLIDLLRNKIFQFRSTVDASFVSLQNGLRQRSEASAARESFLLLDTFHLLCKVEKLVGELPCVPEDVSCEHVSSGGDPLNSAASYKQNGLNMEIISSEMNRLKFYIAHAHAHFRSVENSLLIENMESRINNVGIKVGEHLKRCYVNGLENRDVNTIYGCLRAYAATDNTKDAEDIFRITVVSPFIKRIFTISHSGAGYDILVDELDAVYQQIEQCIVEDCKFVLELSFAENSGLHDFRFLSNSILKEVLSAIQRGKPGVFSLASRANFMKNYKSSLEFLSYLEGYCTSRSAVVMFRREDVYLEFMELWNVNLHVLMETFNKKLRAMIEDSLEYDCNDSVGSIPYEESGRKQKKNSKPSIMNEKQIAVIERALLTEPEMHRDTTSIHAWANTLKAYGSKVTAYQLKNWLNNRKAKSNRVKKTEESQIRGKKTEGLNVVEEEEEEEAVRRELCFMQV